jgi:O-antigen ligase
VLSILALLVGTGEVRMGVYDRLTDRDTAEFRLAAYQAGWKMIRDRPLTGWGAQGVRLEMENRLDGYRGNLTVVHNTYLEVLLEHGLIGFVLYIWIMVGLFKLGRCETSRPQSEEGTPQWPSRTLWTLLLGVYCVNACFVVMNYQFVNGLLFTWAGILARQRNVDAVYG